MKEVLNMLLFQASNNVYGKTIKIFFGHDYLTSALLYFLNNHQSSQELRLLCQQPINFLDRTQWVTIVPIIQKTDELTSAVILSKLLSRFIMDSNFCIFFSLRAVKESSSCVSASAPSFAICLFYLF